MIKKNNWYAIARRKGAFLARDIFARCFYFNQGTLSAPDFGFKISKYKYVDWAHYYDKDEFIKITKSITTHLLKIGTLDNFYNFRKQKDQENNILMKEINQKLKKATNQDLIKYFKKYVELRGYTVCSLLVGNFIVRGLSNLAENTFLSILKKLPVEKAKEILIKLSFSNKESAFYRREVELLHLAEEIKKIPLTKLTFSKLPVRAQREILKFKDKYDWTNSMFLLRKEMSVKDILDEMIEAIKKGDPNEKIKLMTTERKKSWRKRQNLIKQFKLDDKTIKILDLLSESSYVESELVRFYQNTDFYGYPLLSEISKRIKLEFNEVVYLGINEIIQALKTENLPSNDILKERNEMHGFYFDRNRNIFKSFWGEDIDKYRELKVDSSIKEVKGLVACKGKVRGKVRIILETSRVPELKTGEILITMMTTPSFVIAMKRAAAIVTSDGGITCHAAIISRELNKPCIIGTKIATQVFKTGDYVEVDAEKGIIKKLN